MNNSPQRLAPRVCPRCEGEHTFRITADKIECRRCGYSRTRNEAKAKAAPQAVDEAALLREAGLTATGEERPAYYSDEPIKISGRMFYTGVVSRWARASWESAVAYMNRGAWDEAATALKRLVETQRDIPDAYYWLGVLATDPEEKRDNFGKAIGYAPNYNEARKQLLILNGELSEEEAETLSNPYQEPELRYAGGAVATTGAQIRCEACGATDMSIDDVTGLPYCKSCGHVNEAVRPATGGAGGGLMSSLLKRRSQPVQWVVGERILHCKSCGAERTIARKMATYCPFCGSRHVAERDALGSFQQPDAVVPFRVNRKQAQTAVMEQLKRWSERMRGWFIDTNTVKRAVLEPDYLPYWVFDALLTIRRTVTMLPQEDRRSNIYARVQRPTTHMEELQSSVSNKLVPGVKSPSPLLLKRIEKYNLDLSRPYSPDLLAENPAQIYSVDFDRASLDAREAISEKARADNMLSGSNMQVLVTPLIYEMNFRLVLVPVWVATLYEVDGDVRVGVINGQNGAVALGKARKSR